MRVRVDEPGNERVLRERDALVIGKACRGLGDWKHCLDAAVTHGDGVIGEDCAGRLDGDEPARLDDEAFAYLGAPWISTTTRRLGARHSMSCLRCFCSGQDFTGAVLPKPKVSTFDASMPLETR